MFRIGLFLSVLLGTQLALAAIPPLSEEMREAEASHIIEGKVLQLHADLLLARGENTEFQDWHYTALVEVRQFIKAATMAEIATETIQVNYWKPAKRPQNWTGPQGQNDRMLIGDEVRLFMKKDPESDEYHLLTPNGFELLEKF